MFIRTFDFTMPVIGLVFLFLCALVGTEMHQAPIFLKAILGGLALLGFVMVCLPSCRAKIDMENNEIVVQKMLLHVIPIRRKITISDVTTMRVLRRPVISSNGGGPTNIDVEALQLVEKTGRKTNVGHFHGYARSYQRKIENGRTKKEFSGPDLFGEVVEFLQSNLRANGRPTILVGHTQENLNYFG